MLPDYRYYIGRYEQLQSLLVAQIHALVEGRVFGLEALEIDDHQWSFVNARVELSSLESDFFDHQINPVIEGVRWFRGIRVEHSLNPKNQLVILVPFCNISSPHLTHILVIGYPPVDWVEQVVDSYISSELAAIEKF